MRSARAWRAGLLLFLGGVACRPAVAPATPASTLTEDFDIAVAREARSSTSLEPYLRLLDRAANAGRDEGAVATTLLALDALLRPELPTVPGLPGGVAGRHPEGYAATAAWLRRAHAEVRAPWRKALYATALHELALRVGATVAAHRHRRAAGCPPEVSLVARGVGSPSVSNPRAGAPMPRALPGPAPFRRSTPFVRVETDACTVDLDAAGRGPGPRWAALDVRLDAPEVLRLAVTASADVAVTIQGVPWVVHRPAPDFPGAVRRFGEARVGPGRARLWLRVASPAERGRVRLQLWGSHGQPLEVDAPRAGDVATASVADVRTVAPPVPPAASPAFRAAVALALGQPREARRQLSLGGDGGLSAEVVRLRAHAMMPKIERGEMLEGVARFRRRCPDCWEPTLRAAQGAGGPEAVLAALGGSSSAIMVPEDPREDVMRVAFFALAAARAGFSEAARRAYDVVAARAPRTPLTGQLDEALFFRRGPHGVAAACAGATDRTRTRCFRARLDADDPRGAFQEMNRLRALRGNMSLLRADEVAGRLRYGDVDGALRVYAAMLPVRRPLAPLDLFADRDPETGRRLFDEAIDTPGAPRGFPALGASLDPTFDPIRHFSGADAARSVAADRRLPFAPAAATAVLQHRQRYVVEASGRLRFLAHDLRRITGASPAMERPRAGRGRWATSVLRQRLHRADGSIEDLSLEGDRPASEFQVAAGDYLETWMAGWGLPDDRGQLSFVTPDVVPRDVAVRDASLEFERPVDLLLSVAAAPGLGRSTTDSDGVTKTTTWRPRVSTGHGGGTPGTLRVSTLRRDGARND
ncbi:MAG: hypothetical protein AAF715_02615 [Myxococcota bacterium]